jgi:F-type H+-transporting ATPase subunit b
MRKLLPIAAALIAAVLTAAPAFAEKEEAGHATTATSGHDAKAEHGGASKVDIAKSFGLKRYDLGIYTLIVFLLLLVILGKFAWGPMMSGLEKREASLRKVHDDAEAARTESQKALTEVQARLAKANDEIRAMLDEARRDAQVVKDQMKADAAAEATADRDRMRREIEMARDQALQEIYQQAVQLASLVSTKAIQRELTPADHERLLDGALADLRTNLGTSRPHA